MDVARSAPQGAHYHADVRRHDVGSLSRYFIEAAFDFVIIESKS